MAVIEIFSLSHPATHEAIWFSKRWCRKTPELVVLANVERSFRFPDSTCFLEVSHKHIMRSQKKKTYLQKRQLLAVSGGVSDSTSSKNVHTSLAARRFFFFLAWPAFESRTEQRRPTLKRTLWRLRCGPWGVCEGTDGEAAQKRLSVEGVRTGLRSGVLCTATMGTSLLDERFVERGIAILSTW